VPSFSILHGAMLARCMLWPCVRLSVCQSHAVIILKWLLCLGTLFSGAVNLDETPLRSSPTETPNAYVVGKFDNINCWLGGRKGIRPVKTEW